MTKILGKLSMIYAKFLFLFAVLCYTPCCSAQDIQTKPKDSVIDDSYREDQFYVGITFNLLVNKPKGLDQNGFSGGLHLGYIRDMPINQRRNVAIGLGGGFSMNTYNENLFIGEDPEGRSIYKILGNAQQYNKNWFTTYLIEAPIQLRWRTSTASNYKFWRVYAGLKLGYIYAYKANFEETGNQVVQTDIPELDRLRAGATFSFGYGTFNFYFYYSLTPLFKDARIEETQEDIGLNAFKLGLIFYIL